MKNFISSVIVFLAVTASLSADAPTVSRLEVRPGPRILHAPAKTQQLAVVAHFIDGAVRDVTRLTVFTTSNAEIARVNDTGLVEFEKPGEVAVICRYLTTVQTVRLGHVDPKPGYAWPNPPANNFIDTHAFAQMKRLKIAPSDLCDDGQFIRRAYLDACAILPTPDETRKFLADKDKDKRAKLIDRLLDRPEYADFWTYHWMDALNVSVGRQRANALPFQGWVREHVKKNTPVDRIVRDILAAEGNADKNPAVGYYTPLAKPTDMAEHTATVFLGIRLHCASCHDQFDASWTRDDYHGLSAFFAQVQRKSPKYPKQGIDRLSLEMKSAWLHPETRQIVPAKFLGGPRYRYKGNEDLRAVLADWITAKDNPFFARVYVNRVWSKLFGKGIVELIDDFRPSNPSANDELLDALASDFIENKFDQKRLIRTIMNSRTYQLSAKRNPHNGSDEKYFSRCIPAILYPEQLLDAIVTVTEVPENFQGMPPGTRFVQMLEREPQYFLSIGQPRLSPCETDHWKERRERSLAGVLHYLNGDAVNQRIKERNNRVGRLLGQKLTDKEITDDLFLAAFARLPTETENETVRKHFETVKDRRHALEDILWALINSNEFIRRH